MDLEPVRIGLEEIEVAINIARHQFTDNKVHVEHVAWFQRFETSVSRGRCPET